MTKISIKFEEQIVVKQVKEDVATVTLELSEDETKFVHDVLRQIGGDPWNSRRKHAESLLNAINSIYPEGRRETFIKDFDFSIGHGIYFQDFESEVSEESFLA